MSHENASSFHRIHYWLRLLYDGAISDIPSPERHALRQGFVAYLDGALRSVVDEHGDWHHGSIVHEWSIRALLGDDSDLRSAVWCWVEAFIKEATHDRAKQVCFSEGLFDDLIGDEEDWLTPCEQPWDHEGWRFVVDKVLRKLASPETHWVVFEAFDEDVERLYAALTAYTEHPISRGYAGPTNKREIDDALTRWQRSQS